MINPAVAFVTRVKVLTLDTSPRALQFVSSVWIPAGDATPEGIARRAQAYREDYKRYFAEHAGEGDAMADPDPRMVLVQGAWARVGGDDDERPSSRATSTTARSR